MGSDGVSPPPPVSPVGGVSVGGVGVVSSGGVGEESPLPAPVALLSGSSGPPLSGLGGGGIPPPPPILPPNPPSKPPASASSGLYILGRSSFPPSTSRPFSSLNI